jgi:hypothetical protein
MISDTLTNLQTLEFDGRTQDKGATLQFPSITSNTNLV